MSPFITNTDHLAVTTAIKKKQVTFIKPMSSALSKTIWMEPSSFLASCCFWWSWRAWAEFSWQNLEWALSRTSRVFPRSSSKSCCIFWYCSCTSSFKCCTLSWGSADQRRVGTKPFVNIQVLQQWILHTACEQMISKDQTGFLVEQN